MHSRSAPESEEIPALPWDLDELPSGALRDQLTALATFVAWLRAADVDVPACWYTHGWVVRRLLALSYWHEAAHAPGSHPRDAAEWWVALESLRRDWEEITAHRGKHGLPDAPLERPQPVASLDQVIEEYIASRAT